MENKPTMERQANTITNTSTVTMDRRQFVISAAAVGGGMMIGIGPIGSALAAIGQKNPWDQSEGTEFTGFISIAADNTVTVRGTTGDMGQGTFTGAPMMVTEELKCDWDLIVCEFLEPNRDLQEDGFYSSTGYLAYFTGRSTAKKTMDQFFQVAASARERLRHGAAQEWGVPVEEVKAAKSILTHTPSGRTMTFGHIAAKAAAIVLDPEPTPSNPSTWTFLGKESPRKVDLPLVLNGSKTYGIDVIVPNMVHAALRQVPVQGGRLKSVDADAVRGMPGVIDVVVVDPDEIRPGLPEGMRAPFGTSASRNGAQAAVAVVADHFWQAKTALDLLPVEWDPGEGAKWNTANYIEGLRAATKDSAEANVTRDVGDVTAALATGKKFESLFHTPYQEHMNMEPFAVTVKVTDDRVDVWASSQHPQQDLYVVADETGVHPKNVHVHPAWLGTGFGRRVFGDIPRMAAAVAKKVPGRPVKVMWTREEQTRQGRYRDIVAGKYTATVDDDGMPKALKASVAGSRASVDRALGEHPYQTGIENWKVQSTQFNTNLMPGPWRAPVYNSNAFFTETFINELAESAGKDPVEYRRWLLRNWDDKGWINSLDEVAQKAGWGESLPRGLAQGIAISNWGMGKTEGGPTPFSGTTVAAVVTAEVSRRGQIYIPRVDVAFDCGSIINRDLVTLACESGVIMSLSAALHEEINIKDGAVVEGNYDHYRMYRQNDPALPEEIHVHFGGLSGHERFSEMGEPPMGPPPPALAHAIFRLTGTWMRSKPFNKYDLT
jgi:isoquinoline 1-oxidoreductase beta subunit